MLKEFPICKYVCVSNYVHNRKTQKIFVFLHSLCLCCVCKVKELKGGGNSEYLSVLAKREMSPNHVPKVESSLAEQSFSILACLLTHLSLRKFK